ncbi:MAG: glycosyltransferase [Nocardioidaceae bacterium]
MRILLWHVHGSWTTAFVQGGHEYVVPVTPARDADGLGRARTWTWPANVVEVAPEALRGMDLDAVVLQRPHELDLVRSWAGRVPGGDLPAVYLEHNTPEGEVPRTVHPMADQGAIPVVHVTHFNRLMWDCGSAPTQVVEHGVVDPGYRYSGTVPRAAVAVNDPIRRGRFVGTDLLAALSRSVPLDVFGMRVTGLAGPDDVPLAVRTFEDLPQHQLHIELSRRRVYLHTTRWTSLGLSLIEAMMLGLPVVALGTTEVHRAVPPDAGFVSCDPDDLAAALRLLVHEPALARQTGMSAREAALARYGLTRFLHEWDAVLGAVTTDAARPEHRTGTG